MADAPPEMILQDRRSSRGVLADIRCSVRRLEREITRIESRLNRIEQHLCEADARAHDRAERTDRIELRLNTRDA